MTAWTTGLEPKLDRLAALRARLPNLRFPLVLLLIIICFYWKLVFTYEFDWMWGPDMAQQILPERHARV